MYVCMYVYIYIYIYIYSSSQTSNQLLAVLIKRSAVSACRMAWMGREKGAYGDGERSTTSLSCSAAEFVFDPTIHLL